MGKARNGQVITVRQTLVNLGLNTLICSGLRKFFFDYDYQKENHEVPEVLITMFADWVEQDCSKKMV